MEEYPFPSARQSFGSLRSFLKAAAVIAPSFGGFLCEEPISTVPIYHTKPDCFEVDYLLCNSVIAEKDALYLGIACQYRIPVDDVGSSLSCYVRFPFPRPPIPT